jgi:hypothetical protein
MPSPLTDIEIFIGGIGAIVFAISYMTFFNWRKTEAGKALMHFVLSLVALFLLSILSTSFGDYPMKHDFRLLVYAGVAIAVWRLVWVLWRNWRKGDERPLSIETKVKDKE